MKRLGLKDPADYNQVSRKLGVNLGHWSPETLEPGCHSLPHPKKSVVYILRGEAHLRRGDEILTVTAGECLTIPEV